MQEQARRLGEPLRWGQREKAVMAAFLSVVALALLGLIAYGLTSGAPARADCISLSFPNTLGASEVKGCGARARTICASGAYRGISDEMRAQCTEAGFSYREPGERPAPG
jgi:hypothetical protein